MTELKAGPRRRRPTPPGQVLANALAELNLSIYAAGPMIGLTKQMLGKIINGQSAITPETALRLGKFFDNGPEIWMALQADVDLWDARARIRTELDKIKPAKKSAA